MAKRGRALVVKALQPNSSVLDQGRKDWYSAMQEDWFIKSPFACSLAQLQIFPPWAPLPQLPSPSTPNRNAHSYRSFEEVQTPFHTHATGKPAFIKICNTLLPYSRKF